MNKHTAAKHNDTWAVIYGDRVVEDGFKTRAAALEVANAFNIIDRTTDSDLRETAALALIDAAAELRAEFA
jgi:hypothetical protein